MELDRVKSVEQTGDSPDRVRDEGGFTVLDGVALVVGAAIASVHLREIVSPGALTGSGWGLMWLTFFGISLSATGPAVLAVRRFSGRPGSPPMLGDYIWALLGAPWIIAALPKIVAGSSQSDLYELTLTVGLGLASVVTLAIIWSRWVMVPSTDFSSTNPGGWTHRIGLALGVAWPIQSGFGLIILGGGSSG